MKKELLARRAVMSALTTVGAAFTVGSRRVAAAPAATAFEPARHVQDEWLDKMKGKHRVFIDTSTPRGAGEGIQYANNLYSANKSGYGLNEEDLAIVLCLRHQAALFAFNDVVWSKHGKALSDSANYVDPRTKEAPLANPYTAAPRNALPTLAKRGVQIAVCDLSTRRLARMLAGAGGDTEAMYAHLTANGVPNSRFVPAGVVALTRSQEYGFSVLISG
jgi:intracellular sulfur oxidation DsrE/DsrF family protein